MKLNEVQQRITALIPEYLNRLDIADPRLSEAMHYALMNGGKRLRPFLVYATLSRAECLLALTGQADATLKRGQTFIQCHVTAFHARHQSLKLSQ